MLQIEKINPKEKKVQKFTISKLLWVLSKLGWYILNFNDRNLYVSKMKKKSV